LKNSLKADAETQKATAIAAAAAEAEETAKKEEEAKALKKKKADDEKASREAADAADADAEKASREAASKKSGISFQTILMILAILLIGITLCVKIFLKPEEKFEEEEPLREEKD